MVSLVAISTNIATALAVTSGKVGSISRDYKEELEVYTVANDSDVVYDQYDSLYFLDKDKVKKGKNLATAEFNASNYILEKRVRDYGDTVGVNFKKLWYVQIGLGASQIPPAKSTYKMNLLTQGQLGIGKLLNGYNSVRLSVDGGIGYFNNSNDLYLRIGGQLDYLFSFTNYIYGYKPTRTLDVSAVLGAGFHHNMYEGGYSGTSSNTPEAHAGLQFKFFTGPQGYFALEPYAGIGHKNMDLSGNGYWRQYDLFYGVNASFIYFLSNNMTPNEMAMYHLKKTFKEFTHEDSVKYELLKNYHERAPWFIQTSAGAVGATGLKDVKFLRSVGHTETFAIGKWISSRFGLRASFVSRQITRQRDMFKLQHSSFYGQFSWESPYVRDNHSVYQGFNVEAMINLGGFKENYNWDAPFGATLLFGLGAGTMTNYYTDDECFKVNRTADRNAASVQGITRYIFEYNPTQKVNSFSAEQYTAGFHLWAKLTQDLQLFLEPRWSYYMYKKAGSDIDLEKDQEFSLQLGFTMNLRTKLHREHYDYQFEYDKKLYLGLGGGLNFEYTKGDYEWRNNMYNFNGVAFVGYRFNKFHGLRFSVEMASFTQNSIEKSILWNLSSRQLDFALRDESGNLTEEGAKYYNIDMYKQVSYEQWTRCYLTAIPSLSYTLNLTNLLSGYKPGRRTNLDLVLGPSFGFLIGEQHMFYGLYEPYVYALGVMNKKNMGTIPSEITRYVIYPTIAPESQSKFTKLGIGGHIGLNLTVKLYKNWGMFASPMFYIFGSDFKFNSSDEFMHSNRVIMTGNIGATYTF